MSFTPKHDDKKPSAGKRLARHARGAAQASDRLLDILGQDIGEVGSWALGQAQAVSGSLSAALSKTIEVTRRLRDQPSAASSIEMVPEEEASSIAGSPLEALNLQSSGNLDLLSATQRHAATSVDDEPESTPHVSHSPGVLPILEALERVVVEHAKSKTSSLDRDFRFWKLIELLQALTRAPTTPRSDCNAGAQCRSDELNSR